MTDFELTILLIIAMLCGGLIGWNFRKQKEEKK